MAKHFSISDYLRQDFYLPAESIQSSRDFRVNVGEKVREGQKLDYLVYLTSKGTRVSHDRPLSVHERIWNFLKSQQPNSIVVSRPATNTTLLSLIYLLRKLNVQVGTLITDVGFLDFTPKNLTNVIDFESQAKATFPDQAFSRLTLPEHYLSIYGEQVPLFRNEIESSNELISAEIEKFIDHGIFLLMGHVPEDVLTSLKKPKSINPCFSIYRDYMNKWFTTGKFTMMDLELPSQQYSDYFMDDAHLSEKGHEWVEQMLRKKISI